MQPVRVTSPAPVTTPKMPSSGRVDTSDGMAAAAARAISNTDGRIVNLEAAIRQKISSGGSVHASLEQVHFQSTQLS